MPSNSNAYARRYYRENADKAKARTRAFRKKNVASVIVTDTRKTDRKRGFEHDLSVDFVASLIASGCSYCGETELRMTVDRIDNWRGHTKDNVVAACIRCNFTRRSMPYEAWLHLVDGMRRARESGAFGEWTGAIWKTKTA